jgi:hypothetical protein
MTSFEFSEMQWAEEQGELLDDRTLFGTVVAAIANFGMRHPEKPIGVDDVFPRPEKPIDPKEAALRAAEKLTAKPKNEPSDLAWNT